MSPDRTPARRIPIEEVDVTHVKRTPVGPGKMGLEIGQTLTEGERQVREYYDLPTEQGLAGPDAMPISGVSIEFSTAVAGVKAAEGTLGDAIDLIGMSDQSLRDLTDGEHFMSRLAEVTGTPRGVYEAALKLGGEDEAAEQPHGDPDE